MNCWILVIHIIFDTLSRGWIMSISRSFVRALSIRLGNNLYHHFIVIGHTDCVRRGSRCIEQKLPCRLTIQAGSLAHARIGEITALVLFLIEEDRRLQGSLTKPWFVPLKRPGSASLGTLMRGTTPPSAELSKLSTPSCTHGILD